MLRTNEYILSRIKPTFLECVDAHSGAPLTLPLSRLDEFFESARPVTPDFTSFINRPKEFLSKLREQRNTITFEKVRKVRELKPKKLSTTSKRAKSSIKLAMEANLAKLSPMERMIFQMAMKSKGPSKGTEGKEKK